MFGKSYLLDLYNCEPHTLIDDLEVAYRYLEELVDILGMTKQGPPVVLHGPRLNGRELFPEKVGISGWVPLIESGIQIHTILPKQFISVDVFTCGKLDTKAIIEYTRKVYNPSHWDERLVRRGKDY